MIRFNRNNPLPHPKYPSDDRARSADILCFCHLRWNFVFQRPQHLMVRWAKERRVFYIEEHIIPDSQTYMEVKQCSSGVYYVTPHLPKQLSLENTHRALAQLINELMEQFEIHSYINWYYTPMALPFTEHLSPLAIVYDCMDELSHFKGADPLISQREKELFKQADVVFTGGESLYRHKKKSHSNVHAFPSSVDYAHFSQGQKGMDEPDDQAQIPHPRIGFYGVIDERFDIPLIEGLARKRPDWHIVLIGPVVKIDPSSLPRFSNIHYLGQKKYEDLPQYLSGWDVSILPFAKNDSTKYISPTKTLEYMAAHKPIVSTSIEDVVDPFQKLELVRIADTIDTFNQAIEEALSENTQDRVEKAEAYLKEVSWDKTLQRMRHLVEEALKNRNKETLRDISSSKAYMRGKDTYDYVVVGAGFAGSVIAERLASTGKKILICDKRPHIGGNTYDHYDSSGILVHKYGPHIFHTNSDDVYNYLSQFTKWYAYEHRVLSCVDGKLLPVPINLDTINKLYDWNLTSEELEEFFKRVGEPRSVIRTSEDVIISKVGRELYEKFFKNYTRKQWGLDPSQLDASVIARIPVRTNRDDRYFSDKYQVMPALGFTKMFEHILSHPNITQVLDVDYHEILNKVSYKEVIYSGPIDLFFDYCYGKLPYRSLQFKFETHNQEIFQAGPVINFPNEHNYTRSTEFKYLTGQRHKKTSIVYEFPQAEGDPYYPIPRPENNEIYRKYQALADRTKNVHFVGRLGTYKYYNMDQVVAQALTLAAKLIGVERKHLLVKGA
jgi:UDP-galactopyranose mutase